MRGGDLVARVLERHGVRFLFTLCGGHIAPILVGCKERGLRVVDVRHEASAVFAADAVARLTGTPGVAAVTAGPGVTNTVTAVQNARLAQSPVVILGGAAPTLLRGRGALQDIDQLSLMRPLCKAVRQVAAVRQVVPALEEALQIARSDVPGPVFVEIPVDLLYDEKQVADWYGQAAGGSRRLSATLTRLYLRSYARRLFAGAARAAPGPPRPVQVPCPRRSEVGRAARLLRRARRPLLLVGSGALLCPAEAHRIASALGELGIPTYLAGMARGLLGPGSEIQLRHGRSQALREADLVITAGLPQDFRLGYGRQIRPGTRLVAVNRSAPDLHLNCRPTLAIQADPGRFLLALAREKRPPAARWGGWLEDLRARDRQRQRQIEDRSGPGGQGINPLYLCQRLEHHLPADSVLVADGGDFVATAACIVRPRRPLSWLDPGVFGTLGVGGGFALGASLCRPQAEVWLLYGDGSCAFSLAEFDTFVRHGLRVIALVGNDASWAQIAREQVELLGDPVGTRLLPSDYHLVAEGYGGRGLLLGRPEAVDEVLAEARRLAAAGSPVLVNALLSPSDFRKGSISM
jgi:acetolactate synthase-1/2/3 large subunit